MTLTSTPETAEAAWDEDGASPSREALRPPFHAHNHPHEGTPRHPSADPVVLRSAVTA